MQHRAQDTLLILITQIGQVSEIKPINLRVIKIIRG